MDLENLSNGDSSERDKERVAEETAQSLHNSWGVGSAKCDGSGILVFLSVQDRVIYISTSLGIQRILTKMRIDRVIDRMKPYLREEDFAKAVLTCIERLDDYITKGPPSFLEKWGIVICAFTFATICLIREKREKRERSIVFNKLNQLDKDKALALKGKYECSSCPICLEDFQEEKKLGSDGKLLEVLHCGHAFDQTCWKVWIKKGNRSSILKCPICKIEVAKTNLTGSCLPVIQDENLRNRRNNSYGENERDDNDTTSSQLISFQQERAFRLSRLLRQHPRIVTRAQINRWSDSKYDGKLMTDKDFLSRNIDHKGRMAGSNGSNDKHNFRAFGGGRSTGGSGGSW